MIVLGSRQNRWFEQGGISAQYSYLISLCSTALGLVGIPKETSDRITALKGWRHYHDNSIAD